MTNNKSSGMKIFLGVALAVIFFALFNLGVSTFYPGPEYSDYCYNGPVYYEKPVTEPGNDIVCPSVCSPMYMLVPDGRPTSSNCYYEDCGSGCGPNGVTSFANEKQCKIKLSGQDCWTAYDLDRNSYDNTLFYFFVIPGLIIAIVGLFLVSLPFQLTALGAGIALIIEGIVRNLENKIPAFIAGVIVFAILSYFVWRKFKD